MADEHGISEKEQNAIHGPGPRGQRAGRSGLQLDGANITVEGVTAITLFGELHHEDGTTLLK